MHSNYILQLAWVSIHVEMFGKKRFSIYTIKAIYHDYRLPQSQTFLLRSLRKKQLTATVEWVV